MSLERNRADRGKQTRTDLLKAALFGATILGAGGAGVEAGATGALEQVNRHLLTPPLIHELKIQTGATDEDIAKFEGILQPLLVQELARTMRQNQE